MHEPSRSRLLPYGVALALLALGVAARWQLEPVLGRHALYSTFFPAVMIAAYFGGLWPGLVITGLSVLVGNASVEPRFTVALKGAGDTLAIVLFVLTGAMISGLCESLHRARRRVLTEERSRAQRTVREAEERFRQMAENIHEIFWVADLGHTRIMYVSPGYDEVWGRTTQSLYDQPRTWLDSIHPDDRPAVVANLEERRRGVFNDLEFRIVRPDGAVRWLRSRAFPIKDPEGRLSRIAGLAEDVTDRKAAEEAVRKSEERFRSTFENAGIGIALCDIEGNFVRVNQRFSDILGYRDSELCGRSYREITHPDDQLIDVDQIGQILRAERASYSIEKRYVTKDGSLVWVDLSASVLQRDADGNPLSLIAIIQDITQRRAAEAALSDSEERFRGTFENAAVGIGHVGVDGRWIRVNQRLCDITGYPRDELLVLTFQEITHPDDLPLSVGPFNRLWGGELLSYSLEKRYIRKDGSTIWIETTVSLKRDAQGRPTNTIAIVQDISERKRLEEELRKAKELAEAANQAKDDFLANVSHEIRTPMNAILGMTELVLESPLSCDQRQSLRTVKSAAESLLGIINDLLDFSKIEAGKLELDRSDFSLRAAVGDTLRALAVRAHRKGLELLCNLHADVPDGLLGDAGRFRQVLLNLIGNAIKFTDRGEVIVQVSVARGALADGDVALRISVRDTGIGIPPEKQTAIFRAFEQEDTSTTRKYGGTGLGLTISAQLAALMDGGITVESEPGRGSTFTFTARFGRQTNGTPPVAVTPAVELRGLRVLLVEDNAANREIIEHWLRDWQMEPTSVADGMAAMDALWHGVSTGKPHALLLLDGRLPDVEGLALAAKIRARPELAGGRIILLTSDDRPGALSSLRDLRVDAQLLKPLQQEELLGTIRSVMAQTAGPQRAAPAEASPSPAGEQQSPANGSAVRVLVAEDSEFNAQLMEKLLVRHGYTVALARDGEEALSLARTARFDLLLLDVHMPKMDGFEVIRAIRGDEQTTGAHLPVVALTARSRAQDRQRCLAAGMDDFLSKPILADALWATIDRVLATASPPAERSAALLNPKILLAACGEDEGLLRTICDGLRATLPPQLASLRSAFEDRDGPRLRALAHKLCGMVGAFSTTAAATASELEDSAGVGDLDQASRLVPELESRCHDLLEVAGQGLSVESLRRELSATIGTTERARP